MFHFSLKWAKRRLYEDIFLSFFLLPQLSSVISTFSRKNRHPYAYTQEIWNYIVEKEREKEKHKEKQQKKGKAHDDVAEKYSEKKASGAKRKGGKNERGMIVKRREIPITLHWWVLFLFCRNW